MGGPSFSAIRQFTVEIRLALRYSPNFSPFSSKIHSKSHPKSLQKQCRIPDRILLCFENASELILEGLGDLKIIKIAFPSLTDLFFGGETRAFLMSHNKSQKRSLILVKRSGIARSSLGPRANVRSDNATQLNIIQ